MRLTKEQLIALKGSWEVSKSGYVSFLAFRRSVMCVLAGNGAVTVAWCGMWLCIETDGHTHT